MSEKPNIILIMTDQQRVDTIAAWGNDHMTTPAMDRLAAAGTSFRQAFCPGAPCVASRSAIFTGMYPHTTGTYSFDSWAEHRNWVQDLADGGYFCINIGKMHFTPRDVAGGLSRACHRRESHQQGAGQRRGRRRLGSLSRAPRSGAAQRARSDGSRVEAEIPGYPLAL